MNLVINTLASIRYLLHRFLICAALGMPVRYDEYKWHYCYIFSDIVALLATVVVKTLIGVLFSVMVKQ